MSRFVLRVLPFVALLLGLALPRAALAAPVPGGVQSVAGVTLLNAIACPTTDVCYAVGTDSTNHTGALVAVTQGTADSAGATAIASMASLSGIACVSADVCDAVGRPTGTDQIAVLPIFDGVAQTPITAAGNELQHVACASATVCVATDNAQDVVPLTVSASPVSGNTPAVAVGAPVSLASSVSAIACPTAQACYAAIWTPFSQTSDGAGIRAMHLSGSRVTPESGVSYQGDSAAFACPTASTCQEEIFTGSTGQSRHFGVKAWTVSSDGLSYASGSTATDTSVTAANPTGTPSHQGGIACFTSSACIAAGTFGGAGFTDELSAADTTSAALAGAIWPGTAALNDIACPTSSLCVAVGETTGSAGAVVDLSGQISEPLNVTATAGVAQVTVSWTPPLQQGFGISSYTITPSSAGCATSAAVCPVTTVDLSATPSACAGTSCSALISNLTLGADYTFTVTADDAVAGPPSAPSNSVRFAQLPGAPSNVQATAGYGSATVTWQPPTGAVGNAPGDGGSPITAYTVSCVPACASIAASRSSALSSTPTFSYTVGGLTNGTPYTFTVTAVNALGSGAGAGSASVTPGPTSPDPAGNLLVTPTAHSISASWDPPANLNGTTITGYDVALIPQSGTVQHNLVPATDSAGDCSGGCATQFGSVANGGYTLTVTVQYQGGNTTPVSTTRYVVIGTTRSLLRSAGVRRVAGRTIAHWTVVSNQGIAGFTLSAGHHSLSHGLIPAHAARVYRYAVSGGVHGAVVLHTVLADGKQVTSRIG